MERPANVVRASDNSPCLPWVAQLTFIQVHLFCWRDWSTFADMFSMPRGETARFLVRRQTRAPSCCAASSTTFELFVRSSLRTKKIGPERLLTAHLRTIITFHGSRLPRVAPFSAHREPHTHSPRRRGDTDGLAEERAHFNILQIRISED